MPANEFDVSALPDIQNRRDSRNVAIDHVGVKGVRYPVVIMSTQGAIPTIGEFSMSVGLKSEVKGTHMSRFIEMLESHSSPLTQENFVNLARATADRLDAPFCEIELKFPFFQNKSAPVSGAQSLLDYDVVWRTVVSGASGAKFTLKAIVPATSLCPCSKEISKYGAHNQRSLISIEATLLEMVSLEELVNVAQNAASCEVYGLLKRPDEKFVTERAYDNPKFVEDMVRDVAVALSADSRILDYAVEVENFESIHNHTAYARIVGRPDTKIQKAA
ncbi:GTP cyclohydrolase FolE2 [Hyphococcus luteus]|uniref:GTP cyclohydrolase FolE2 n=1 Tax=Hyphococcus luteus TaxID=2058213 RepID=A0A2S7KB94_9PROT|nr:GTP cyclohydrolase FolE2 [Marinicaulis flavus]PQA89747.1 GTP cyclohydrolase I FolE2 [Marinicaulis flavus]